MTLTTSSIALDIATFKSQALNTLQAPNATDNSFMSVMASQLQAMDVTAAGSLSALASTVGTKEISSVGRNMALFDPESAYRMMTDINKRDVYYKAQFSELSQMGSRLVELKNTGLDIGRMTLSTSDDSIKSDLQHFVTEYNSWVLRFDLDLRRGGLLAGTQAAQVSQYELEQSVKNMLNGAKDGLHGLSDLGIIIDSNTKLASLDSAKLDSMLVNNKQGVVDTVQEFSANFAKSAGLLNSEGNFMSRQLDNLKGAIQYITDNKSALQVEFGTGDIAQPTGQIAQALAAYNLSYAT